jgi:hypothetical protein
MSNYNSQNISSVLGQLNSLVQTDYYYNNQIPGMDLKHKKAKVELLSKELEMLRREIANEEMYTPLKGPTPADLETYPALKNSWTEFLSIKKLLGLK